MKNEMQNIAEEFVVLGREKAINIRLEFPLYLKNEMPEIDGKKLLIFYAENVGFFKVNLTDQNVFLYNQENATDEETVRELGAFLVKKTKQFKLKTLFSKGRSK